MRSYAKRGAFGGLDVSCETDEVFMSKDDIYREYIYDERGNLFTTLDEKLVDKYHLLNN